MQLDMMTMSAVDITVTTVLGLVLVYAWSNGRNVHLVGWWGLAMLLQAGSALVAGSGAFLNDDFLVTLGLSWMILGDSVKWTASREFVNRAASQLWMLLAPAVFLLVAYSGYIDSLLQQFILYCVITALLNLAAAVALARANDRRLISHWPAVVLLAVTGIASLVWIPFAVAAPFQEARAAISSNWFSGIDLIMVVMRIALAFVVLGMAKHREEMEQRLNALTDALTGLPNRRALYESLDAFERSRTVRNRPVSVLFFDLDHFKTINDTYGHGTGDCVLRLFAAIASARLDGGSIVARLGGEEFAAILPGVGPAAAAEIAEDVRKTFAECAAAVDGQNVDATVSVGGASTSGTANDSSDLGALFRRADAALYGAKRGGRNRVEFAESTDMTSIGAKGRTSPRRKTPVASAKRAGRVAAGT